jgi:hypothetical protein
MQRAGTTTEFPRSRLPLAAGPQDVENSIQHRPQIGARSPSLLARAIPRQQRLDAIPQLARNAPVRRLPLALRHGNPLAGGKARESSCRALYHFNRFWIDPKSMALVGISPVVRQATRRAFGQDLLAPVVRARRSGRLGRRDSVVAPLCRHRRPRARFRMARARRRTARRGLANLKVSTPFDRLRDHPRFGHLLDRMQLAYAGRSASFPSAIQLRAKLAKFRATGIGPMISRRTNRPDNGGPSDVGSISHSRRRWGQCRWRRSAVWRGARTNQPRVDVRQSRARTTGLDRMNGTE